MKSWDAKVSGIYIKEDGSGYLELALGTQWVFKFKFSFWEVFKLIGKKIYVSDHEVHLAGIKIADRDSPVTISFTHPKHLQDAIREYHLTVTEIRPVQGVS